MGNTLSPCYNPNSKLSVKLVFWEGTTRIFTGSRLAGEVMFKYPDSLVCHADSFYIGLPIPALAMDDELMTGETYFVLPVDRFACKVLSASLLAALGSSPKPAPINFGDCPFQYVKGTNGQVLIKVMPEFIMRLISRDKEQGCNNSPSNNFLCSTPELQKHYDLLVGSKEQTWSPKLDTISECKTRCSPLRLLGMEWKSREVEG